MIHYRRNGFTLVELLVAMGIISLLAAILLPVLSRTRESAQRTACINNLRQIGMAFELYLLEHNDTYPAASDPVSVTPFYWLWMGRGWRQLLDDYVPGDKDDPGVFYCPTDPRAATLFESTSYAYSMAFYHSTEQIDNMSVTSAAYLNPVATIAQRTSAVATPSKKILAGEWYANHAAYSGDPGWFGKGGKRVFLFADGHVEYLDWTEILPANDGLPHPNLTVNGIRGRDKR